ncbi:MAG: hypothetical protein N2314_04170 [Brevinematales bacterium]|nr:hypothetical protein [Brevinematales bacterium]
MTEASLSGQGWLIARGSNLIQSQHMTGTLLDPQHGRRDFIAFGAGSEKSQRSQTLLLGNEVKYLLEDRGKDHYVLIEATLVSENREIKENPEKLKEFFLLCDVWYHLLYEEKPYPEVAILLDFLRKLHHTRHMVVVHLLHFLGEENIIPRNWKEIPPEEKSEYLTTIGLSHWRMGSGTQRFLADAMDHPLEFFVDKIPSPAVMREVLALIKAAYESYTGREMFSLDLG